MKRNMDLILKILQDLEVHCKPSKDSRLPKFPPTYKLNKDDYVDFPEYSDELLMEHCRLIVDRGLAEIDPKDTYGYSFVRLTWEGHDFVDNASDSSLWQVAKSIAGNMSFKVFTTVLEQLVLRSAMNAAGLM